MKLIKSLACLLLVSAVKISAAAFEETNEETNFDNLANASLAAQNFFETSIVEVNTLGMTSTIDYPLTSAEAAALSLTSLFSIITDDATITQLRSAFGVFSQDSTAGIEALSAIEFTSENVTDLDRANLVKQSIAALFFSEGSALRDSTVTSPWGISSDGIVVPESDADADTATILSLNYFQTAIIQLAREESTIGLSEDSFLSTLTLLTYGADEALSVLQSQIGIGTGTANFESPASAVKLELMNALRQEVQRLETANVSASMMSSSFIDHATSSYQPVGLISVTTDSEEAEESYSSEEENIGRDRLASVDRTLANIEYEEDL
ncbi:MAG: hypothetical protein KBD04_05335 [Proteobacteria bacterium]|nr:hypothetical protein [Pseudomonadota bacterium]